jgi:hypothetical protein
VIGTRLIEELAQSVALTHLIRGHKRVSLLILAAPESGKTTITNAATAKHICRVAVITGRSIIKQMKDQPDTEFLLFNDLSAIRAMSHTAVNLLIVLLNQLTQDEQGIVAFAGRDVDYIKRPIGIMGCLPFETFVDHRASWKELGFVSRMLPFAYAYPADLVAEIKDAIDENTITTKRLPFRKMPRTGRRVIAIHCGQKYIRRVRALADARSAELKQLGIRLLQNYHCLIRAHALLFARNRVTDEDLKFLRTVDHYISITRCEPLERE